MKPLLNTDKFLNDSNKRLVTGQVHYVNAKLLGSDLETISEFPSRTEANEALPALKALYPDHTVFASLVSTCAWAALSADEKSSVMDILEDMTQTVIGAPA